MIYSTQHQAWTRCALATVIFLAPLFSTEFLNTSIFNEEQVIFTSPFNITKLLVQLNSGEKMRTDSETPTIFFTLMDPRFDGGSCIYVLDIAAYEVLEGGRDSTVDYGSDRNVYFGSKDGVYKYDRESLSAKKFGPFRDSIIQLQKVNGSDKIYFLTDENKLFALENQGTIRSEVELISCATQFVLDTSNNIYYVECGKDTIFILRQNSNTSIQVLEEFNDMTLVRPPFILDESIPLIGDGQLYLLHGNGTCEMKDFYLEKRPSAYSVDTTLYILVALDGKIYEYYLLDAFLKYTYGLGMPLNVNRIIMSIMGSTKDLFGSYK